MPLRLGIGSPTTSSAQGAHVSGFAGSLHPMRVSISLMVRGSPSLQIRFVKSVAVAVAQSGQQTIFCPQYAELRKSENSRSTQNSAVSGIGRCKVNTCPPILREEEENNLSQMKKLFFYMFG